MMPIKELRAICDAATPKEWFANEYGDIITGDGDILMVQDNLIVANLADANFVTTARTALPAALDRIEELESAIKRSGLDGTMCGECGEFMLTLPDGGNICAECAEVMG